MDPMQTNRPMELREYVAMLRRRRSVIVTTFVICLLAGLALAVSLPPVYRSTATILIEREEIPSDLVDSTVTGYIQERIENIRQRLMTPARLWEIAERIDYAPEERAESGRGVLKKMSEGIEIQTIDVQTTSPGTGRKAFATVAFTISFQAQDPRVAQEGANALARIYLEQDRKRRTAQVEQVSEFLEAQAERLSSRISKLEKQLARFKQKNVVQLPEHSDLNMRLLEKTDEKVERTRERIQALENRRIFLKSKLASTDSSLPVYSDDGKRVMSLQEQLSLLKSQYLSAKSRYSAGHPDVVRLKREIDALQEQTGLNERISGMRDRLKAKLSELDTLRQRYSDRHPDVRKVQGQVKELRRDIERQESEADTRVADAGTPTNPAYIQLETELDALQNELEAEQTQLKKLRSKRAELERRLFSTPAVEKDYLAISRDYKNALEKYREIKDKQLQAQASEQLEKSDKSQRLSLISPAGLPGSPQSPNRTAIGIVGAMLGLTGGISMATVSEYLDRTVRGVRGVRLVFEATPIATIPPIETRRDRIRRRVGRLMWAIVLLALTVMAAILAASYWGSDDAIERGVPEGLGQQQNSQG